MLVSYLQIILELSFYFTLSLSPLSLANFNTTATTPQEKPYESFFRHDSGRWLYNEDIRLAESYQEFGIRALKRVAARALNQNESEAASIRKTYEDDLSRTFAIAFIDGTRVIARIPHPLTAHKRYATASEVATMDLVRNYGLPTPKVLTYDITADNEVGTQYIVMEAAQGQNVGKGWDSLDENVRGGIVAAVVYQESRLMHLRLPASGSIQYKRDLEPGTKMVEILPDLSKEFGAATSDGFCNGPRQSSEDYLRSVAERELAWVKQYALPRYPNPVYYRRFFRYEQVAPEDHIKNLEDFLRVVEHLTPRQMSTVSNAPVVLQNNMQLRNLFVNSTNAMEEESDPIIEIVSMTNWGQASVLPLFLHAGIPPPLSSMSELYTSITRILNLAHTTALQDTFTLAGHLKRSLCKAAATPWKGDNVTLEALLIRAVREWPGLTGVTGTTVQVTELLKSGVEEGELPKTTLRMVESFLSPEIPACYLSYSLEEVERSDYLADKLSKVDKLFDKLRKELQLDRDGFVVHDKYKDAKATSEGIKKSLVEMAEDKHVEKYEYGVMWTFDDHDESGQFCALGFDDDGDLCICKHQEAVEEVKEGVGQCPLSRIAMKPAIWRMVAVGIGA